MYVYDSDEPNAFATGRNFENSVVAVSSSLLDTLNKEDLSSLLDLISLDDDNLYKFKTGMKTSILIKENKITKLFG